MFRKKQTKTPLEIVLETYSERNEQAYVLGGVRLYYGLRNIVEEQKALPVKLIIDRIAEEIGDISTIFRRLSAEDKLKSLREIIDYSDFNTDIPLNIEKLYQQEVMGSTDRGKVIGKLYQEFKSKMAWGEGVNREYDLQLFQSFFKYMVVIAGVMLDRTGWSYKEIGEEVIRVLDVEGLNGNKRNERVEQFQGSTAKVSKPLISDSPDAVDTKEFTINIDNLIQDFPPTEEDKKRNEYVRTKVGDLIEEIYDLVDGQNYSNLTKSEKERALRYAVQAVENGFREQSRRNMNDLNKLIDGNEHAILDDE